VNNDKWPGMLKIQISVIAALLFVIWIVVQNPAQWG
jgi:hypothetical protein